MVFRRSPLFPGLPAGTWSPRLALAHLAGLLSGRALLLAGLTSRLTTLATRTATLALAALTLAALALAALALTLTALALSLTTLALALLPTLAALVSALALLIRLHWLIRHLKFPRISVSHPPVGRKLIEVGFVPHAKARVLRSQSFRTSRQRNGECPILRNAKSLIWVTPAQLTPMAWAGSRPR